VDAARYTPLPPFEAQLLPRARQKPGYARVVRTLGIDLSTDDAKVGVAQIEWRGGAAEVVLVELGWGNDALQDLAAEAGATAIDAPFGWPDEFRDAVDDWAERGHWASIDTELLRYRLTDRVISTTKYPLSVSSDRIASTAMRCSSLLHMIGEQRGRPVDRVGADGIFEVYPAAALTVWTPHLVRGYKGTEERHKRRRREILDELAPPDGWLLLNERDRACCVQYDDALDALVASLVARAAAQETLVEEVPAGDDLARAKREGWIHAPRKDTFDLLPTDRPHPARASGDR
jgi:predicted nuclease with RNAse H fold